MSHTSLATFITKSGISSDLNILLKAIADACVDISKAVAEGALLGTMGSLDASNIQGETQKQLDVITNDIFIDHMQRCGQVAGLASEEMEDPYAIPVGFKRGRFLVLFDPLDGSSNVNLNISVGTIFSVLTCPDHITNPEV